MNGGVEISESEKWESCADHKRSILSLVFMYLKIEGLCSWEDMPEHLQFNRYIKTGYRRLSNWKGCILSLFQIHNETSNIFTHLPMALYTMVNWWSFWPWDELGPEPSLLFSVLGICNTLAMVVPWLPSAFYHLFMCHSSGQESYSALLSFDVFGIWVTEFFGSFTNLTAAIYRLDPIVQRSLMIIFIGAALLGLVQSFKAHSPAQRVLSFSPLFIARALAFGLRLSDLGGGEISVLHHILLQDVTSIVGGFIGAARLPERWLPGKCDYWFNSHNIMHVFVIMAALHMNAAANGDARWMLAQGQS